MKKSIIVILVLVLAVGGYFTYRTFSGDDELVVKNTQIETTDSSEQIEEQDTPEGTWVVQKQDDVFAGYEIQELFGGDTVKVTASGSTNNVEGSFSISGTTLSNGKITVDMTTLSSDESRRDNSQKDRGLETQKFPQATFKQTDDVTIVAKKNEETTIRLTGILTLHGVEKEVEIEISATWTGKVITVAGELAIELSDFDIEPPDSGFVSVDDNGKLKFQLLFVPKS